MELEDRGEAEEITVAATVERETVEYLRSTDEIRYVASWQVTNREAGEPPERAPTYETTPFEAWARTECAHVGRREVTERLERAFGAESGIGATVTTVDLSKVIAVWVTTVFDADGSVVSEPTVTVEEVRKRTPATVRATISIGGREYTHEVPTTVEESTERLQ